MPTTGPKNAKEGGYEINEVVSMTASRIWNVYAIRGYAAIVARKHNLVTPLDDLNDLSDEEIVSRLQLVRDLAHLPPG